MSEQGKRYLVGLFVAGTLVVLALLAVMFKSFSLNLRGTLPYTVVLDDAPGVGSGTPVRRSGLRIGEVNRVELDEQTGRVRVHLRVEKDHPPHEGDQATLVRGLLGGDATIDFVPRSPDEPPDPTPVPEGAVLAGKQGKDVRGLLDRTSELVPSTQETLDEIRKSIKRVEGLTPKFEEAIKEYTDLAKATREMIPELRRTNNEVQELARMTRDVVPELRRTNEEIQVATRNWGKVGERVDVLLQTNQDKLVKALDNITETVTRVGNVFNEENQRNLATTLKNVRAGSDNLESITKNTDALLQQSRQTIERVNTSVGRTDEVLTNLQQATKPMAERSGTILKNLDESTEKLNRTLTETRDLLRAVNTGDGSLRRFLNDPALFNNLNDATLMLVRIMPRLDRILHDAEVFADKIARHPESLGVGGAVRPSGGLKESPSSGSHWPH